MSEERSDRKPAWEQATGLTLRFLVFLVFTFVIYEATLGLGDGELPANRSWVIVAGMAALLLLLAIDRLVELRVSPGGFEAKLREKQIEALEAVEKLNDLEVAEVARRQILGAESAAEVEAATAMAVDLNVKRLIASLERAIRERLKCYVRYRPAGEAALETYYLAPLDIKAGETEASSAKDYLWAHSYEHGHTVSLRLDRVRGVKLSQERFNPQDLMANWADQDMRWNVARSWELGVFERHTPEEDDDEALT